MLWGLLSMAALMGLTGIAGVAPWAELVVAPAVRVVVNPPASTVVGDYPEAFGAVVNTGSTTLPGGALRVGGRVTWEGVAVGVLQSITNYAALPPGQAIDPHWTTTVPLTYHPGMRDGDPLTLTVTVDGVPMAEATMRLTGVQAPDPQWAIAIPAAQGGRLPPFPEAATGSTLCTEQVLVTRLAAAPGRGTVVVGGTSVFPEGPGHLDEAWEYVPQAVTLVPGQSRVVTLVGDRGMDPVYPGHALVQTFHLSTGQVVSATLPVVSATRS